MSQSAILAFHNAQDLFIPDTDASDYAIGAELSQLQNGKEVLISYGSKTLSPAQRRYCTRKELLAIVAFTRQSRFYLLG
jgi:ribose 1,5-bisphosphokinase PhnN